MPGTVAAIPFRLLELPAATEPIDGRMLAAGAATEHAAAVAAHHARARRLVDGAAGVGRRLLLAGGGAGAAALLLAPLRGELAPEVASALLAPLVAGDRPPDPRGVAWLAHVIGPTVLAEVARTRPHLVGPVDGMPVAARDVANRRIAEQAAGAAAARGDTTLAGLLRDLAASDATLLLVDPARGRAAQLLGDLDAADHVVVVVPGATYELGELDRVARAAQALRDEAAALDPPAALAAVAWLGYDSPNAVEMTLDDEALEGGPLLTRFVDGLHAQTGAATTVVGHSYGSVVAGAALAAGLRVDAVAVTGSPGMLAPTAAALGGTPIYALRTPDDPVALVEWFGPDPAGTDFGATRLDAGGARGHSGYYEPGTDSVRSLALVATGRASQATVLGPSVVERVVEPFDEVYERAQRPIDDGQAVAGAAAGVVSDAVDAIEDALPVGAGTVDAVQDAAGAAFELGNRTLDLAQRLGSPDAFGDFIEAALPW